jgi:CRISPR-associated endonuclease/helicase Cas3
MGGSEPGEWHLYPEENAVLIGTQDMLLSRALNRGYAAPRARWPMEFGLLHQDALWVMDEVQLMDVGLATSAQLQTFRQEDAGAGRELRPCRTWWMSATLQPDWLRSVDTEPMLSSLPPPLRIASDSRRGGLWEVSKPCRVMKAAGAAAIAMEVREAHQPAALTLVVINTVSPVSSGVGQNSTALSSGARFRRKARRTTGSRAAVSAVPSAS